jgi:hypothetical protein
MVQIPLPSHPQQGKSDAEGYRPPPNVIFDGGECIHLPTCNFILDFVLQVCGGSIDCLSRTWSYWSIRDWITSHHAEVIPIGSSVGEITPVILLNNVDVKGDLRHVWLDRCGRCLWLLYHANLHNLTTVVRRFFGPPPPVSPHPPWREVTS